MTACTYFGDDYTNLLAVGWLEPPFEFRTGSVSDDFLARLESLSVRPWEPVTFMGGQFCRFCEAETGYSASNLFIPGADVVYVAPEGIVHYLETHRYLPPEEFRLAVEKCPPFDSMAYYEALLAAGFPLQDPEGSRARYRRLGATPEWPNEIPKGGRSQLPEIPPSSGERTEAGDRGSDDPIKATRDSWDRTEARGPLTPIPYGGAFTESEWRVLRRGLIPRAMEDKWFMYCEDLTLFLHRSWTGELYYKVTFALRRGRARVREASRVDHPEGPGWDDFYHAEILDFLLRGVLLKQRVTFPLRYAEDSCEGVLQHHVAGTGFPEVVVEPQLGKWLRGKIRIVLRTIR